MVWEPLFSPDSKSFAFAIHNKDEEKSYIIKD
jgi:hypothetical protein